jgi:hypothetical protein
MSLSWKAMAGAIVACASTVLMATACTGGDDNNRSSDAATASHDQGSQATTAEPSQGDGGSQFSACSLLTKDDILDTVGDIGFGVSDGRASNNPPEYDCQWNGLNLYVYSGTRDQVEAYFGTNEHEVVDGLGDRAGWFPDTGTLEVQKGNYDLTFQVFGTNPAGRKDQAKALAQKAIARLP